MGVGPSLRHLLYDSRSQLLSHIPEKIIKLTSFVETSVELGNTEIIV